MTDTRSANEIEPALSAAEEELIHLVEEACRLEPERPGAETTEELLRLEEALLEAARAAERTLELRRQSEGAGGAAAARPLTEDGARPSSSDGAGSPASPGLEEDDGAGVREFSDPDGRAWRVWAVVPRRREDRGSSLEQLRAEYQNGWLTFETLDESERRRLPQYPPSWRRMSADELTRLLVRATRAAPRRFRTSADGAAGTSEERQLQL